MYDAAANVLEQRLSQVSGIGDVNVGGSALPAVRVELNPQALYNYGIGLEDVRAALASANANSPKGSIEDGDSPLSDLRQRPGQASPPTIAPLVIAYRNGAAVRLTDVADVSRLRRGHCAIAACPTASRSVLVILYRQPGANIIETVDAREGASCRICKRSMPADIDLNVAIDRIDDHPRLAARHRADAGASRSCWSILVVFLFLRSVRATLIPSVAVPISIIGTFGVMYLLGYSLDNLSLMALTIATGFVVDDAIVVLENISRHIEEGMPRLQAALRGAREVGFTVLSISLSLIAVFMPILLMGGIRRPAVPRIHGDAVDGDPGLAGRSRSPPRR